MTVKKEISRTTTFFVCLLIQIAVQAHTFTVTLLVGLFIWCLLSLESYTIELDDELYKKSLFG
jgi:predicted membrane chloride channel (bestrophin family)